MSPYVPVAAFMAFTAVTMLSIALLIAVISDLLDKRRWRK